MARTGATSGAGGKRKKQPTNSVGGRGPQGLPTQTSQPSPANRRASGRRSRPIPTAPKPYVPPQNLRTEAAQDAPRRNRMRARQQARLRDRQADLRVSGDRPTPGGRTNTVAAERAVRAALLKQLDRELARLRVPQSRVVSPRASTNQLLARTRQLQGVERYSSKGLAGTGLFASDRYRDRVTKRPVSLSDLKLDVLDPAKTLKAVQKASGAGIASSALKTLEQTTRPVHAIAGATDAALRGKNVPKAALRGIKNEDKKLFSDVLMTAGAPKPVQAVGGFALDVLADPTTYATFGTGSVLKKLAADAAAKAEKQALAQGLSREQAIRFGERARQQTLRRGQDSRGVTARFAGKELPGVRRGTAAVGRAASRATDRVAPARAVRSGARRVAADVNPAVTPAGISKRQYAEVRQRTRTARHSISREVYKARAEAQALQKAIGKDNYAQVLDAIEAGTVHKLPEQLKPAARFLRDRFKYQRRIEQRAGVKGATRRNYVPHVRADTLESRTGMGSASVGAREIRPKSSRARTDQRTLAEIRATADRGKYVEDPGVVYAARAFESASTVAKAELNRRLGDLGRDIRPGRAIDLKPGEAVFHVRGSDIRVVDVSKADGRKELERLAHGQGRNGRYVALNEQAIDRALKTIVPGGEGSALGAGIDKVQGYWKLLATQPNPGFHLRNLAGDLNNAYLATRGHRLPANLRDASRVLREVGHEERSLRRIGAARKHVRGTIKAPRYGTLPIAEVASRMADVGAIRSGFQSREIGDLIGSTSKIGKGNRLQALRRWSNNREDLARLSTALDALKQGRTFEEAAAHAARYHFDYSDLTELERKVLRRIMPFYTFSARNIPLQTVSLITRPGKFAQYQKLREEFAKAFGYEDGWESDLPEREQRAVPIPVVIDGRKLTISLGPSGLPLTDLNEFPTSLNPAKQADEWLDRGMSLVTPGIKTPVEFWANFSFFFRDQIERDSSPDVPVSEAVAKSAQAAGVADELGIRKDYIDKRTGKTTWGAPAKVVYALNVLPGPFGFANRVTTVSERQGQTTKDKVAGYLGVRAVPVDRLSTEIEDLYDQREKADKARSRARQYANPRNGRPVTADNPTPAYTRANDAYNRINERIYELRGERGDKLTGRQAKPRSVGDARLDAALDKLPDIAAGSSRLDKALDRLPDR